MTSIDLIKRIKKDALELMVLADKLEESRRESDYENLLDSTEKTLQRASSVYMTIRGLLLWIYSGIPNIPRTLPKIEAAELNVSFSVMNGGAFPIYKLSMPYLLPNKRKRNAQRNDAITNAVISAVGEYIDNNKIDLIRHATVFFVSSNKNVNYMIDNDNKEASIILNGLIGKVLLDDRPTTCNTSYYTKMVDDPKEVKTEVFIVESNHDIEVLSMIKSM